MAIEYRLSYTAAEIDEKLGKVDQLVSVSDFEVLNNTVETLDENVVKTQSQSLTDGQKTQARENIGAADSEYINAKISEINGEISEVQASVTTLETTHNNDKADLQSGIDSKVPNTRTINGKTLNTDITLAASDIGADSAGTADTLVSTHNTSTSAHNDIRGLITDLETKLENFLDVDDTTVDQLSEVLTLIDNNKGTLESLTTSKVNVSDIIDNLTTASSDKVLSANQGVVIKGLIDTLQNELNTHTHEIAEVNGLQSALDGKAESSHGTHVTYSTTAPVMDGTASVGTASTVARSDHKHPTDTSRASQTDLDALEAVVEGKADADHEHGASDITSGTLSSDRLPTIPIAKGGTGATTATAALTNLGVTATADRLNYVASGSLFNSRDKMATLSNAGWYRVYTSKITDAGGDSISVILSHNYSNSPTETYAFSVSVGYDGVIDITQLSGIKKTRISKIRVAYKNSNPYYIDFYYNGENANNVYVSGSGAGTFQSPSVVDSLPDGYSTYEFDTVTGCKTSSGFYGDLTGNASSATTLEGLTSTVAELNILDGVTATASELNKLDGLTATTTELNYVDGVTSNIQTQLDARARGSYLSATTPATAGWYRIATSASGIFRCAGIFEVIGTVSGKHTAAIFTAGTIYGRTDGTSIQVLHCNHWTGSAITKARIVYHTTYSNNYAYVEVYNPNAIKTAMHVNLLGGNIGWTLVTPSTEGSIPDGYTSKEVTLSNDTIVAGTFSAGTFSSPGTLSLTAGSTTYMDRGDSTSFIFKLDGTEHARFDTGGHFVPGADSTYNIGSSSKAWKSVYADTFVGSGASLTSLNAGNISSGTLPIARGGTGATTAAAALTNLGITVTADEINDIVNNASSSGSAGMVREFDSGAINTSTYTYEGKKSKFYIVTLYNTSSGYLTPVIVDYKRLTTSNQSFYSYLANGTTSAPSTVGVQVKKASSTGYPTFTRLGGSGDLIKGVCGYY